MTTRRGHFFLGESIDEYIRSLLKLEGRKERRKEREGGKEKERKRGKGSTHIASRVARKQFISN